MSEITGIGGVFIRARNFELLRDWYLKHLGLDTGQWGKTFEWNDPKGTTAWTIFKPESKYFPSSQAVMINYRVSDLDALLERLRSEGCDVDEKSEDTDFGKFGWVTDPEGNKIELWEPKQV